MCTIFYGGPSTLTEIAIPYVSTLNKIPLPVSTLMVWGFSLEETILFTTLLPLCPSVHLAEFLKPGGDYPSLC